MDLHVGWMKVPHASALARIDRGRSGSRWTAEDFARAVRFDHGLVAIVPSCGGSDDGSEVVGGLVYRLQRNRIYVPNFAVSREHWRKGIATEMFAALSSRLSAERRNHIVMRVRETSLDAQLFLRSMGFLAQPMTEKDRGYYEDTGEDSYVMRYDMKLALPVETEEEALA